MPRIFNRDDLQDYITELKSYLDEPFWRKLIIEGKKIPEEKHHPWSRGYRKFLKLRSHKNISLEIAKMGMEILALMEFKEYWDNDKVRRQFFNKLRHPQEARGLLFELRIAYHFKDINCHVELFSIPMNSKTI